MAEKKPDIFGDLSKNNPMFSDKTHGPKLFMAIEILNRYHLLVKVSLFAILGFTLQSSVIGFIVGLSCVVTLSILEYYRGLNDGTKMMMMYMSNKARDAMSAFDLMNDVLRGNDGKEK